MSEKRRNVTFEMTACDADETKPFFRMKAEWLDVPQAGAVILESDIVQGALDSTKRLGGYPG